MRVHKLFGAHHHLDSLETVRIRSGRSSCNRWPELYVVGADGIAREQCIGSELFRFSFLASSVLFSGHPTVHMYNYNNNRLRFLFVSSLLPTRALSAWFRLPAYPIWLPSDPPLKLCGGTWVRRRNADPVWNGLWICVESARSIYIGESVNHKASNCW